MSPLSAGLPRSEFTGAGAGEKDGQETVVMILCTEVCTAQYSTVQYSTEMARESRRWSHRDKHLGTKMLSNILTDKMSFIR